MSTFCQPIQAGINQGKLLAANKTRYLSNKTRYIIKNINNCKTLFLILVTAKQNTFCPAL